MKLIKPFLIVVFVLGCRTTDREAPSPNPPIPPDSDMCGAMCTTLKKLSCEEGKDYYDSDKPGPKGLPNATCLEFCVGQQKNGVFINPRCVSQINSCSEIETARKKSCK